jgi:protein-tyrosine-phosphatase
MEHVIAEDWKKDADLILGLNPKKILFICVQNSARSQLAEAVARHLAPAGVEIISAGSKPAFVRPEAIQVLYEAGINAKGLYSKSIDSINTTDVDVVITLCAEEVCPVYLGKAMRIHWGLADPAKVSPEDKKLEAFRQVRDELIKRLEYVFKAD